MQAPPTPCPLSGRTASAEWRCSTLTCTTATAPRPAWPTRCRARARGCSRRRLAKVRATCSSRRDLLLLSNRARVCHTLFGDSAHGLAGSISVPTLCAGLSGTTIARATTSFAGVETYHHWRPWFDGADRRNILFASVQGYGHRTRHSAAFVYPGSGATSDTAQAGCCLLLCVAASS